MPNPYEDDFPVLSREEMGVILRKITIPQHEAYKYIRSGRISLVDCERETGVRRRALQAIIKGLTVLNQKQILWKKRIRPLSRWLVMYECGMIKKVDKKIVYLPEPTKQMPSIMRLSLQADGPKVIKAQQRAAPSLMPGFKSMFGTQPDLPLPK